MKEMTDVWDVHSTREMVSAPNGTAQEITFGAETKELVVSVGPVILAGVNLSI